MYFWRIVPLAFMAATIACGGCSGSTGPTGGGQMSNPLPPGTVGVNIRDFSFTPASLTVKVGTTVRWTNQGPSGHTTTSATGVWESATLSAPGDPGRYFSLSLQPASAFGLPWFYRDGNRHSVELVP
jgi:plastocyanin